MSAKAEKMMLKTEGITRISPEVLAPTPSVMAMCGPMTELRNPAARKPTKFTITTKVIGRRNIWRHVALVVPCWVTAGRGIPRAMVGKMSASVRGMRARAMKSHEKPR